MAGPIDIFRNALEQHQAGHLGKAKALYRQVLRVQPDHADALHMLGVIAHQNGKTDQAATLIQEAIARNPQDATYHNNLGEALREMGRFADATSAYVQALALNPQFSTAYNNLGVTYMTQGDCKQAVVAYRCALALRPDYNEAQCNLASALLISGCIDDAIAAARQTLVRDAKYAKAWSTLGDAQAAKKQFDAAAESYQHALALEPLQAEIFNNLGNVHLAQGQPHDSAKFYRNAISLRPKFAEAWANLGDALMELAKPKEALRHYERAISLGHDKAKGDLSKSVAFLMLGDYQAGFALYEQRFYAKGNSPPELFARLANIPRWRGQAIPGGNLLLWAEQGFGDTLMMARYIANVTQISGASITFLCQAALARLFQPLAGVTTLLSDPSDLDLGAISHHCPLLSLPLLLGVKSENPSPALPYLSVPISGTTDRRLTLPPTGEKCVGLAWAGNRKLRDDAFRSIPLERLAPLMRIPGIRFYSLQKNESASQGLDLDWPVRDEINRCVDFCDTANFMQQLDIIISVDTAVAHLAGALGKPVWLLNRHASEWRWSLGRNDSPWYPSMRIFRQPNPNDWESVIEEIRTELQLFAATES